LNTDILKKNSAILQSFFPVRLEKNNLLKTGNVLFPAHEILAISGFTIADTGTSGKSVRFELIVPEG
jgi:hypothetical protein